MPTSPWDIQTIFERSPLLVARLVPLLGPSDSAEEIIRKAREIISRFDERERVATLNAHPRIGGDARALSELSRREQGSDRDAATMTQLATLNDEYERRFGFRFVVFVNGRGNAEILPLMRERLERSRESELRLGMDEFLAISFDRMKQRIDQDEMRKAMDVDS